MQYKKYFLGSFWSISSLVLCCGNCSNEYSVQEQFDYYTENPYKLARYKPEAFQQMISERSPDNITKLRKKLSDRTSDWRVSGTEQPPYEIWQAYRKEVLKELEGFDSLHNFYNQYGTLIQSPTEANEKSLIEAFERLKNDPKATQAHKDFYTAIYNDPENSKLTEAVLSYYEFICFLNKDISNKLHLKIKKSQSHLAAWKKDGYLNGVQLWKNISKKEHTKLMQDSILYQYQENQDAIIESLQIADRLGDTPYTLSCKDLQEILPHGFKLLHSVLDEIRLLEEGDVKALRRYCRLIDLKYLH